MIWLVLGCWVVIALLLVLALCKAAADGDRMFDR